MNEKNTPGVPGQDPTSTDNTNPDELRRELMAGLAVVRELATKILALKEKEEPAPDSGDWEPEPCGPESGDEPYYPPHKPPFALRTDGRLLLCIDDLDAFDLGPREVFRFVVCNSKEKAFILDGLDGAAQDIMGRFPSIFSKGRKDEPEEGGDDGGR